MDDAKPVINAFYYISRCRYEKNFMYFIKFDIRTAVFFLW